MNLLPTHKENKFEIGVRTFENKLDKQEDTIYYLIDSSTVREEIETLLKIGSSGIIFNKDYIDKVKYIFMIEEDIYAVEIMYIRYYDKDGKQYFVES